MVGWPYPWLVWPMFLLYNVMLGGPRVYGWPGAGAGAGGGFHCARTLARRGHGAGAGLGISPVTGYYYSHQPAL